MKHSDLRSRLVVGANITMVMRAIDYFFVTGRRLQLWSYMADNNALMLAKEVFLRKIR